MNETSGISPIIEVVSIVNFFMIIHNFNDLYIYLLQRTEKLYIIILQLGLWVFKYLLECPQFTVVKKLEGLRNYHVKTSAKDWLSIIQLVSIIISGSTLKTKNRIL